MPKHDHTSGQRALCWWRNHKLVACSLTAAFAALCLTAADALPQARQALVAALALAAAGGVREAYDRLPRNGRQFVLSQSVVIRNVVLSVVLAIATSCTYWFIGWLPLRWNPDVVLWLWPKLDFIPSAFSLLLPVEWQSGFHRYFNNITYCFPGPYGWETMRYLRTAILGYSLTIFIVVTLTRLGFAAVHFGLQKARHDGDYGLRP
jgi:hypothetical protein